MYLFRNTLVIIITSLGSVLANTGISLGSTPSYAVAQSLPLCTGTTRSIYAPVQPNCYGSGGALPSTQPYPSRPIYRKPCYFNPQSPVPAFRNPFASRDPNATCVSAEEGQRIEEQVTGKKQVPIRFPNLPYSNPARPRLTNPQIPSGSSNPASQYPSKRIPCSNEDYRPAVYRCTPSLFGQ